MADVAIGRRRRRPTTTSAVVNGREPTPVTYSFTYVLEKSNILQLERDTDSDI